MFIVIIWWKFIIFFEPQRDNVYYCGLIPFIMINPFDDTYFMKMALQEAEVAYKEGEIPVGAVIVAGNRIIARAHNLTERLNDVTAHAEMQAITAAVNFLGGKYLQDCTLYVTLEPCQMCAGALYWSQISRIVYAAKDEERGFMAMKTKLHPKTLVAAGLMEEEASELLKRFFIRKRNLN
jgi:tRNA(adenine34) deaminase